MNVKQGREVVEKYRSALRLMQYPEETGPFDREPTPREAMSHAHGMLDQMEKFLNTFEESRRPVDVTRPFGDVEDEDGDAAWDKFNRWLGFMQGVFWFHGDYTLDMMRDHNRSKE